MQGPRGDVRPRAAPSKAATELAFAEVDDRGADESCEVFTF
jgi:hypothetical protein